MLLLVRILTRKNAKNKKITLKNDLLTPPMGLERGQVRAVCV